MTTDGVHTPVLSEARIGIFNRYMQTLASGLSGPKKLLFDYLLNNLSDQMKEAVIRRGRREDEIRGRRQN